MEFLKNVVVEFGQFIIAPILEPNMLWIVGPMFIVMTILSLYFATHEGEKIGWNTALANSTVLFFIGIDLFRNIYEYTDPSTFANLFDNIYKVIVVLFVMLEGIILSYSAFRHTIPENVMFFIASPITINVQAYVLVVLVYLRVDPTRYTFFAALLLFICLLFIFWYLAHIIKKYLIVKKTSVIPPMAVVESDISTANNVEEEI